MSAPQGFEGAIPGTWICQGCGANYRETDPDLITGHVEYCDYVDGAGHPRRMTVKFSVVHYYIVTVDGPELAMAAGRRQPADIFGPVDEDGPECAVCGLPLELADEGYEHAAVDSGQQHAPVVSDLTHLAEYLFGLAEENGPAEADGVEIADIYPEEHSR